MPIGVARADITPDYPVRLHGYGGRRTNSEGVAQHLFAKALVLGTDREGPRILITVDSLGVPGSVLDEVAARLKKRVRIVREDIVLCSSHTHSAPMLSGVAPNIFSSDIIPEQQATITRYTRELTDKLEALALTALSNRAPAKLSWSEGTVKFAKNRRVVRDGRAQFGENDTAPVDHALAVMIVRNADDKVRAVLANYACHCTTLGGEFNKVHGDWSGCAQEAIERDHPGAVALISIGCGADANPSPRGKLENAQAHGDEIATEVRRLLAQPGKSLTKLPDGKLKRFQLDFDPLPTREQWEERAKKPGIVGYHAKKNLARLDRGEKLPTKLPYSVQAWIFGDDLAMVFLPGEVVVDFQCRLKRELDATRLWVNAYANDAPCYIPSRRILAEGGYEAEDSLWYYDRPARLAMSSEDRIIKAVHDLLPRKFAAPKRVDDAGKTPSAAVERSPVGSLRTGTGRFPVLPEVPAPLSPIEALSSMRVAPEFAVDLVAAEPLVVDPVAIDWGADGKLWVVEMRDYPMGMDGNWQPGGVVKFLEDTNGDGRYDKATEFLENLPYPTGVFAWRKGVLVCAAPDILYAEDTNSDGRADVVRKVFTGFATNNYQARVNSLSLGLDNWIYGANGLLGGKIHFVGGASSTSPQLVGDSRISSLQGELDIRGRDFRINPDTGAFEPASGLTQQGRVRDDFGNWFGCDNSHLLWHYPLGDEYVRRNPHVSAPNAAVPVIKGPDWNRLFPASKTLERFNDAGHVNRTTSACGLEIYRDELLGKEFYGNAFTCEAVHNLVHREVLAPEGVTFRSARATNELDHEFLASTDNWFRPVQARTGPDGALWVVDMYRYVIEHPRWIPSNRLAQLDVRAGDDKGRIYRVYRKDIPPRSLQNFAKLSTRELVAALDSPNGTARDTVHRELLNRGDKSAARKLAALAMKSERPAVRVQALSVLNGLGELGVDQLAAGLSDKDERVREFATRVAGTAANRNERVVQRLLDQVSNFDARLQFQSVLTLGGLDDPRAVQAVEKFLPDALTNAWMRAAVMSGATGHSIDLFSAALKLPESKDRDVLVDGLIATAVGEKHVKEIAGLVVPALRADASVWRLRATQRLYEAADKQSAGKNGKPPDSGNASQDIGLPTRRLAELCRDIIADNAAPESLRLEAVKLFASTLATAADAEFLQRTLEPGPRQGVAVTAVLRNDEEFIGGMVLRSWKNFSPTQREAILSALVTRPAWTSSLLTALEEKAIASAEVPALVRTRLLDPKSVTRERAEKLWSPRASDRAKLIADYSKALKPGNVKSGATVFEQMCANCHTLNGLGNAVGPDIAPLRDKSAEDFLVAILDPNAAIEPRYVNYTVEGKNGTTFSGVIRSETATGVELVAPGIRETVLRGDILRIEASSLSLMPEGLEQGISPAQMNDLIAYLRATPR